MFDLDKTPYLLDPIAEIQLSEKLKELEERVCLLRKAGTLTEETLKHYYGEKRFEQVAESNALEGSTLSAGETEIAVLKGITITGHDPAYIRDAQYLDRALTRLSEMAKEKSVPTDIEQIRKLHELILGNRRGSGIFRNQKVMIRGSSHIPPKTWEKIMTQMEAWQEWSENNRELPAPIRATILHAWFVHIHPYLDGNGRTARAITNLELIRAGYPPIIIRKKERDRYIEALAESDKGGDIRSFFDLIFERISGALTGLELSARKIQGYDPLIEKLKEMRQRLLAIWENSLKLLASMIENQITPHIEKVGGGFHIRQFEASLDFEDYIAICDGRTVPRSWAFVITISIPGRPKLEKLAYVGYRSKGMYEKLGNEGGPSLYWSCENPARFPKWIDDDNSPFGVEFTTRNGVGDEWIVKKADGNFDNLTTSVLAAELAKALLTPSESAASSHIPSHPESRFGMKNIAF